MLLAFYHVFTRCLWEVDLNECSFLWPWAVLASFIKVGSSDSFLASHIQSFFKAWWFYLHSIFTALSFPFPLVIQIFITSFLNISSDFLVGLLFTGLFFFSLCNHVSHKAKKINFLKNTSSHGTLLFKNLPNPWKLSLALSSLCTFHFVPAFKTIYGLSLCLPGVFKLLERRPQKCVYFHQCPPGIAHTTQEADTWNKLRNIKLWEKM